MIDTGEVRGGFGFASDRDQTRRSRLIG